MANDGYRRPLPADESHDGGPGECYGCGHRFADKLEWETHVCDERRVAKVENSRRATSDEGIEQGHGLLERLADGFRMLKDRDVLGE